MLHVQLRPDAGSSLLAPPSAPANGHHHLCRDAASTSTDAAAADAYGACLLLETLLQQLQASLLPLVASQAPGSLGQALEVPHIMVLCAAATALLRPALYGGGQLLTLLQALQVSQAPRWGAGCRAVAGALFLHLTRSCLRQAPVSMSLPLLCSAAAPTPPLHRPSIISGTHRSWQAGAESSSAPPSPWRVRPPQERLLAALNHPIDVVALTALEFWQEGYLAALRAMAADVRSALLSHQQPVLEALTAGEEATGGRGRQRARRAGLAVLKAPCVCAGVSHV
jgi:hypothetical protein